ncbi:hypothetical protein ACFYYY_22275 [Streptomyces sp. NPDC001834]
MWAFRQRGEAPQLSSCARQGLRDSPYVISDIFSRRIVGHTVERTETAE